MDRATGMLPPAPTLEAWTVDGWLLLQVELPSPHLPEVLSPAEREVVLEALVGASNAEIAHRRQTSVRTVANQLRSACTKLHVSGRAELAALAAHKQAFPR